MENINNRIFIHYGHKEFDNNLWEEIHNIKFCKPYGGLWASDLNAKFGWKDWNEKEHYTECEDNNSFKFKLKKGTKLYTVNNLNDLNQLPLDNSVPIEMHKISYCLDFKKIKQNYDAIEVNISNDNNLYWKLYSWDCDNILILNKDCIELI